MYLFLCVLVGLIIGGLIDLAILVIFEGIKKLTVWLTNEEPEEDTFANMVVIIYNIAILIITLIASVILYFILN